MRWNFAWIKPFVCSLSYNSYGAIGPSLKFSISDDVKRKINSQDERRTMDIDRGEGNWGRPTVEFVDDSKTSIVEGLTPGRGLASAMCGGGGGWVVMGKKVHSCERLITDGTFTANSILDHINSIFVCNEKRLRETQRATMLIFSIQFLFVYLPNSFWAKHFLIIL